MGKRDQKHKRYRKWKKKVDTTVPFRVGDFVVYSIGVFRPELLMFVGPSFPSYDFGRFCKMRFNGELGYEVTCPYANVRPARQFEIKVMTTTLHHELHGLLMTLLSEGVQYRDDQIILSKEG